MSHKLEKTALKNFTSPTDNLEKVVDGDYFIEYFDDAFGYERIESIQVTVNGIDYLIDAQGRVLLQNSKNEEYLQSETLPEEVKSLVDKVLDVNYDDDISDCLEP